MKRWALAAALLSLVGTGCAGGAVGSGADDPDVAEPTGTARVHEADDHDRDDAPTAPTPPRVGGLASGPTGDAGRDRGVHHPLEREARHVHRVEGLDRLPALPGARLPDRLVPGGNRSPGLGLARPSRAAAGGAAASRRTDAHHGGALEARPHDRHDRVVAGGLRPQAARPIGRGDAGPVRRVVAVGARDGRARRAGHHLAGLQRAGAATASTQAPRATGAPGRSASTGPTTSPRWPTTSAPPWCRSWSSPRGSACRCRTSPTSTCTPPRPARGRPRLRLGRATTSTGPRPCGTRPGARAGTNLAFLGANTMYWRVRLEQHGRHLVTGYRDDAYTDPLRTRGRARRPPGSGTRPPPMPENALVGMLYECYPVDTDYRVVSPAGGASAAPASGRGR